MGIHVQRVLRYSTGEADVGWCSEVFLMIGHQSHGTDMIRSLAQRPVYNCVDNWRADQSNSMLTAKFKHVRSPSEGPAMESTKEVLTKLRPYLLANPTSASQPMFASVPCGHAITEQRKGRYYSDKPLPVKRIIWTHFFAVMQR